MVKKITEFVYVIEHEEAANNVIIIGKKGVILVDTSLFPEKAKSIAKFIRDLTMKPVQLVFNTHYHPDHTFGNSTFDCPVVAHNLTREKMEMFDKTYFEELGLEYFELHLPDIIFEDEFVFEDNIKIEFIHGPGHTPDSSYVYIPQEDVLITGDTVINSMHPEIVQDSNLNVWIKTLESLPKAKHVVPGHGDPGDYSSVKKMIEYLDKLKKLFAGELSANQLEFDPNFSERKHAEILEWSIRNLLS
ncbi:MAG TPA: MBL fold metallo-hydrolase [Fervidobacterium sp.]|nr:MBL fold metallo-hydrolase [Fervidobacterium sp.]HOK87605.1 MBL fold metallo-hydrolase [Fervidobacterium sp.]HOM73797.1 MBL fold metallo-hydrolase [Fervidobacterium sp.]HOQ39983.1 MBL fold metallo-hydrolase [Fervidobacterium sp.]HPP17559.1 MBL fold metallo-hydrolase [Fervidobacterium sp.]